MRHAWPAGALVRLWLALAILLGGASAGAVPRHGPPELAALTKLLGRPIVLCHHDSRHGAPDQRSPLDDCACCDLCHLLQATVDLPPSSLVTPRPAIRRRTQAPAIAAVAPARRFTLAAGPRGPPKLG